MPSWRRGQQRPLRLFDPPQPVEALALLPDRPPERLRWRRLQHRGAPQALRTARVLGRYLPFGPYLALGIGIVLLDWKDVLDLLPFGLG